MPALKADSPPIDAVSANGGALPSLKLRPEIEINGEVDIPADVVDLESFCRWTCSNEYPEHGQFSYLAGRLWVDLTMEDFFLHNQIREAIGLTVGTLARQIRKGRYIPDGMWMKNQDADLSTEPDGMFATFESFRSGRVWLIKSPRGIRFQLNGTPEMALEIVSSSSKRKDTKRLLELYWKAGIPEYWLVDVREGKLRFVIFKHGPEGYSATRRQAGGWLKSGVFGKSFRLTEEKDPLGEPLYSLEVQD